MSNFKWYGTVVVLLFTCMSCEEVIDWDLPISANSELVIEAIVTNEEINQEIRLTLSHSNINDDPIGVTDAVVQVTSDTEMIDFILIDGEKGLYRTKVPFAASKDVTYHLMVRWNGIEYQASSQLSFVSALDPIVFSSVGQDSLTLEEIGSIYHPLEQSMYKVNISWDHLVPSESSRAQMLFYTFKTIDGSQLLPPEKEKVFFPPGSIVTVRKFGLNPDFASYLRTLVLETEWQGGAFDEASSSLVSNISSHAHGFFSVTAVVSTTVIAR
jgi:hypothetical protein